MYSVLVVGDALVDLTTHVPALPNPGGCAWGNPLNISLGGSAANISFALKRLNISNSFFGAIGNDLYGQFILEQMQKEKIDTSKVRLLDNRSTGMVVVLIDSSGERTFIAAALGAAHSCLTITDIDEVNLSEYQAVVISGVCLTEETSRQTLLEVLQRCSSLKVVTYFDPNLRLDPEFATDDYQMAQLEAIKLADVILVGDNEIKQLFGVKEEIDGVQKIIENNTKMVVVKKGNKGASYYTRNKFYDCPAFSVSVVNTTGAGDAFDAGFIAAQLSGMSIEKSLLYANAVAAIKVTQNNSVFNGSSEAVMRLINE